MRRIAPVFLVLVLGGFAAWAGELSPPLQNWPAPETWSPAFSGGGLTKFVDLSGPLPFIPITPCRVTDTRAGSGFPSGYGPPSMGGGVSRNFTIAGKCGIPSAAAAVSFNFAVWNTTSYGDFKIYPQGAAVSAVSTLNWGPSILMLANAAVVPLGSGGGITVVNEGSGTVDLFFDVNGYYSSTPANQGNNFSIYNNSSAWTIYALNASTTCTGTCGIEGEVIHGTAVYGHSHGHGIGVFGDSETAGDGVFGLSDDASGAGVHGLLNSDVPFSHAVFGEHASTGANGIGVEGKHSGTGWGVYGHTVGAGAGGKGVLGESVNGHGVEGASVNGWGVFGATLNTANDSAGIVGFDGYGANETNFYPSAAIRGYGLLGLVGSSSTANGVGVSGSFNNSSTGNSIAIGQLASNLGANTYGVFAWGNYGGTGAKFFIEPHPTDPSRVIRYIALEGAESGTYFRGTARTVNHEAVIEVPDDFRMVTDQEGLTVQLTPVGASAKMYVAKEGLDEIVVHTDRDVTFHYMVNGVRRAFKDFKAVTAGQEFMPRSPNERMPLSLTEEAKRRLIANGTYNPDGTVNMDTAERVGWTRVWAEQKAAGEAAAEARRQAMAAQTGQTSK